MLTILVTSARVAPGLLSWPAWDALRTASRVLVGSADHPQVAALASAGVVPEVVDVPPDPAGLAAALLDAVLAGPDGAGPDGAGPDGAGAAPVVWLAPPGVDGHGELLDALAGLPGLPGGGADGAPSGVRVLHGSRDLPGAHLLDVVATMDTLRTSCPWDRKQTHESLAPHLLEEPYEALEALENGDQQALREELGDVLMQVVFHARIAAERSGADDGYTIDDIADTLVAKLVRRHPHVFGGVTVGSADEVISNWDAIKKAERAAKRPGAAAAPSALDGVVLGQPALSLAAQVLRRAARAGFPGEAAGSVAESTVAESTVTEDTARGSARGDTGAAAPPGLGDELFHLVARAAEAGADAELELRAAVRQLMARVRDWEMTQR
jgi:XTP/dITP diphosphohydrolase